ncbi:hypothetical protein ACFFKC_17345 [Pseudoduganella danionis]|uniref:DUF4148 domain-containing protein n=1 Tax=Pseudoduganella danionis TaxID=1890295 RepID=A0ABW9SNB8_9BURK|nr:hypothetical protein [Pseudoduganella danionis]
MGITHKKMNAAASAYFCVRSSVSALLACGMVCAGLAQAAEMGEGQHRDEGRGGPGRDMSAGRGQDGRGGDMRQIDPRSYEARAEEQRRAMQEAGRNAEMNRRAGRLTPDERRDLRRQINEAGQDIYANPPRR